MNQNWFKLVQIGIIIPNRSNKDLKKNQKFKYQDQVGHRLNLWSCLYGICKKNKYMFEMAY